LKGDRTIPEEQAKKKEKNTPAPIAYNNLDAWKSTEP
jgi:hypothetical protein